ncbi:MAG: DegT/DnrJ/EryC1/StrS family aminotransferase [Terriglobia bacterium]
MNMRNCIPLVDLIETHVALEAELTSVFKSALRSGSFIGGPMVEDFEAAFAEHCGVQHAVGVGSGTDALRFALMAAGVKMGDIVLTVPNTFIATAEAISQAGAKVDFVDIDARTYNLDPEKLRAYLETECEFDSRIGKLIHKQSKMPVTAVVPVHIYGQPADMDPILELATQYNLIVIEDACQAHGAEYFSKREDRWKKVGSMGRAAAFSFYPGKNLGACGEAGAVTTNDDVLARKVRMLRDHGQARKYYHDVEGYNGRLDAIQAGILKAKLRFLSDWNKERRQKASIYHELLAAASDQVILPHEPSWANAVHHLFVIRVEERDQLREHLSKFNIGTGIHYPVPLHLQKAYARLGYNQGDFPVAECAARQVLSLPMYPQIKLEQQHEVADRIISLVSEKADSAVSLHVPVFQPTP